MLMVMEAFSILGGFDISMPRVVPIGFSLTGIVLLGPDGGIKADGSEKLSSFWKTTISSPWGTRSSFLKVQKSPLSIVPSVVLRILNS